MTSESKRDYSAEGQAAYNQWRDKLMADPEFERVYDEEAAKLDLWLQLVEARMDAGLTQAEMAQRMGVSQAQVARIEKKWNDAYTLNTLRRYVKALGEGFKLEVKVLTPKEQKQLEPLGSVSLDDIPKSI